MNSHIDWPKLIVDLFFIDSVLSKKMICSEFISKFMRSMDCDLVAANSTTENILWFRSHLSAPPQKWITEQRLNGKNVEHAIQIMVTSYKICGKISNSLCDDLRECVIVFSYIAFVHATFRFDVRAVELSCAVGKLVSLLGQCSLYPPLSPLSSMVTFFIHFKNSLHMNSRSLSISIALKIPHQPCAHNKIWQAQWVMLMA